MGSTPDTIVSIYDVSGRGTAVAVIVYRNVDPDDALDDTPTEATGASGLPNAPSFTCATPNALRVAVGIIDRGDAVPTLPAGFTDLIYKQEGEAPFSATVMVAHRLEATPGALDPDAFGGTGDDNWWACHFAWKPAPDPAPAASSSTQRGGLIANVGSLMRR